MVEYVLNLIETAMFPTPVPPNGGPGARVISASMLPVLPVYV